jgi:pimeloyl-ACP methyl ester carboxylesterase
LAWFIGTAKDDVTRRYVDYIRTAVDQLGIKKVLLVGTSSGGFGAIAMAPNFPEALAIAFSPQTHVGRFGEKWANVFTAAAFPEFETYSDVEAAFGRRVDLAELYLSTNDGRVWYVQNDGDDAHVERQMGPFMEVVDGRVTFVIEHHANGHTPPTVTRLRQWIEYGIENFDGDPRGFALKRLQS